MSYNFLIHSNNTPSSKSTEEILRKKLINAGIGIDEELGPKTDLIVCIGGDGAFLEAVHAFNFPDTPFVGVNTGHLGFFQEFAPEELDTFIENFQAEKYVIQTMTTAKALIEHDHIIDELNALNEIIVKSDGIHTIHLDISIGSGLIERFSGDGVLVSTPAGSTAYNYSLRGSIVDPRLNLLQVTPIAPINTTAYRSFTSSILLPPDLSIEIKPDISGAKGGLLVTYDSYVKAYDSIDRIEIMLSEQQVHLVRFENYNFWTKVKTKFL